MSRIRLLDRGDKNPQEKYYILIHVDEDGTCYADGLGYADGRDVIYVSNLVDDTTLEDGVTAAKKWARSHKVETIYIRSSKLR